MKKRRITEQIVGLLRQADVDLGKGSTVPDVCRRLGIRQHTHFRRRTADRLIIDLLKQKPEPLLAALEQAVVDELDPVNLHPDPVERWLGLELPDAAVVPRHDRVDSR